MNPSRLLACLLLLILQVVSTHTAPDVTVNGRTFSMESQWEQNNGSLAMDGDPVTCAQTGFNNGPWWKVHFPTRRVISAVTLVGSSAAFEVRVGDRSDAYSERRGFEMNPLCGQSKGMLPGQPQTLHCRRDDREGAFLSVHVIDPQVLEPLQLCEVYIS